MLRDLVKKAQGNDKEAMLKLIEQFVPCSENIQES